MTEPLFLDDLRLGQRFTSAKHVVAVGQIKRFAGEPVPALTSKLVAPRRPQASASSRN